MTDDTAVFDAMRTIAEQRGIGSPMIDARPRLGVTASKLIERHASVPHEWINSAGYVDVGIMRDFR